MQPAHPPNRLAAETSPYLLQHAHNPVDWYPWGPEAFDAARTRDVPIFLSIGYSTCYWCHVMERESFEHVPTAELMNRLFVCIKVDREERPDIDDLYMAATTTLTGRGGWPMSLFLEPATLKPYFCGTYFPREPRPGMPTFERVLNAMSDAWINQRDAVIQQADALAAAVAEQLAGSDAPVPLGEPHITQAIQALLRIFDKAEGGFGRAPKFPQPVFLDLLLAARASADDEDTELAIDIAVRTTLDKMMIGGVADHVGGGFHRYSVDEFWTVPHFEKMLYDNAQLATTYAAAAAVYSDAEYGRVVRTTLDYVLREMADAGGGFHSAQDAEVDGREGQNYLWTPEQMAAVLDADDAELAVELFGLAGGTNFQDPHHLDEPPSNVLRFSARIDKLAEKRGLSPDELHARLDTINTKLLKARDARKQPRLDDKVLTAWNGLMIVALVAGAELFGEQRYYDAASTAADALLSIHRADGALLRSSRAGQAKTEGFLDDHAMLAAGLLALHRSGDHFGGKPRLDDAIDIVTRAIDAFGDGSGGFYDTRAEQDDLFVRARSVHDGAIPSGAGYMLGVLVELASITGEDRWLDAAVAALESSSAAVASNPLGAANSLRHMLRMIAMGDAIASRYKFATDAVEPQPAPADSPVEVYASVEQLAVSADAPASFRVSLKIDPDYHIVAADPGPEAPGLVPLRVGLVRGQGVAVYADYPAGEEFGVEGVGTILVHHGEVEFEVAVERAEGVGAGPGEPVLGVTFQACTETACLQPTTVELRIELTIT